MIVVYKRQEKMPYGFEDFMGNTWPDVYVDRYNDFLSIINKTADKKLDTDSLAYRERVAFLELRHDLFTTVMGLLAKG